MTDAVTIQCAKLRIQVIALLSLSLLVYWNSLHNGFIWLDQAHIVDQHALINSWQEFLKLLLRGGEQLHPGYHRPMLSLIHSVDKWWWHENPVGFHISSLFLHGMNSVLVLVLLRRITNSPSVSFVTAVIWAILPGNSEAVSLIHGKADLLAAFFVLSSLCSFFVLDTATLRYQKIILFAGAIVAYIVALLSKESALGLPIFLIAICLSQPSSFKSSNCAVYCALICATTVVYICYRIQLNSLNNQGTISFFDRLLTFIVVYVRYIFLTLTAVELTTNDTVLIWYHEEHFLLYVFLFATVTVLQIWIAIRYPIARLGVLWFNAFLVPVAQIHPLLHFRADRYLYLPSIGFVFFIVLIVVFLYKNTKINQESVKKLVIASTVLLVLAFGLRIRDRNRDFHSNYSLFVPVVERYPACREARSFLGYQYMLDGRHIDAEREFKIALQEDRSVISYIDYTDTAGFYGLTLLRLGKFQDSRDTLAWLIEHAEDQNPEWKFNLALANRKLGNYKEAQSLLDEYVRLVPTDADGLFLLGSTSMILEDLVIAESAFSNYLKYHPSALDREYVESLLKKIRLAQPDSNGK